MSVIAVLFAGGLLYYTLSAFSEPVTAAAPQNGGAELESALMEIIDLEADFDTGKLSQSDFLAARFEAEERAAKYLKVKKEKRSKKRGGRE